ncbi:thiolase family protein [Variovorax sp. KK3]|uniref:thiolase family protein n=1 Tax=Variovorax sp. KK3 TaxID=1855728 RepID=UPI00097C6179|nr:thiolase family protein [Variovorax sp. KK3]
MTGVFIPYGAYWSSPFARWQGSLSHLHSLEFCAWLARRTLAAKNIDTGLVDFGVLGTTVPQRGAFYGLPWVAALAGMPTLAGPTLSQACATSARCVATAMHEVAGGAFDCGLVLTADRVSNGPQLYYPDPRGVGGTGLHESWVTDSFERDPWTSKSMLYTAEAVAARFNISLDEQHEAVLLRYEQYAAALANDHAFHRRYMQLPFEVPDARFKKSIATLSGDEGIHATTREGLSKLKPVMPDGTVTYGAQTHPADGNAGMLVATRERARQLSARPDVQIEILSTGQARTEAMHMPYAPVPAARQAMERAGLRFEQLHAVTTHNPFAVNDIVLARETGLPLDRMNSFGCSLVWGHPQAPTGLRAIIELIEALEMRGGGLGLFTGCAAGDTAMALVLRVGDAAA